MVDNNFYINKIFNKLESESELTPDEVMDLIKWNCKMGGFTIEDVRNYRKTRHWPRGSNSTYFYDAEMLLWMIEDG